MLITALLMSVVLTSPSTSGDPAGPQDGVVATAPATPVMLDPAASPTPPASSPQTAVDGLTTDEQIARWLSARAVEPTPYGGAPLWRDDRKPHGEVSIGVGTGGYRDYGVAMSLPIGESGRLDLSYRQAENGYPYGYGYDGHGYEGYGYDGYGGPSAYSRSRTSVTHGFGEWAGAGGETPRRRPAAGSQQPDQP